LENYFNKLWIAQQSLKPVKDVLIYKVPQDKELHRLVTARLYHLVNMLSKRKKFNLIISKLADFMPFVMGEVKELGYLVK
jgi:hypothetical protein